MDKLKFLKACAAAENAPDINGIGTLGQKTLHAVLKLYFEPDVTKHEIKVSGSVADIVNEEGIYEIQTRDFNKLCIKLSRFLPEHRVTIVYPAAHTKWLCWVDGETGKVTDKTKSRKTGGVCAVLSELIKIKPYLLHLNLRLCVVLIDLVEYRNLNGWGKDKKRGSSRNERIPVDIYDEIYIETAADYMQLVPEALGETFTGPEFAKEAGLRKLEASSAINVLAHIGVIRKIGTKNRYALYERSLE